MSTIHIKKSHEGRFTAYKKRTGKTTEEALHSKDPHVRAMANFARNAAKWNHAFGGPLYLGTENIDYGLGGYLIPNGSGIYAEGGQLPESYSDGGYWTNGLTEFNTGGSHEENPNQGIPQGMGSNGQENKVEEGETKWNNYIFSNRLPVPPGLLGMLGLSGTGKSLISFSDASKKLQKESEERPNDPISRAGLNNSMAKLKSAQDYVKAQQQAMEQGARQMAYGGNLFDEGGPETNPYYAATDAVSRVPAIRAQRDFNIANVLKSANTPEKVAVRHAEVVKAKAAVKAAGGNPNYATMVNGRVSYPSSSAIEGKAQANYYGNPVFQDGKFVRPGEAGTMAKLLDKFYLKYPVLGELGSTIASMYSDPIQSVNPAGVAGVASKAEDLEKLASAVYRRNKLGRFISKEDALERPWIEEAARLSEMGDNAPEELSYIRRGNLLRPSSEYPDYAADKKAYEANKKAYLNKSNSNQGNQKSTPKTPEPEEKTPEKAAKSKLSSKKFWGSLLGGSVVLGTLGTPTVSYIKNNVGVPDLNFKNSPIQPVAIPDSTRQDSVRQTNDTVPDLMEGEVPSTPVSAGDVFGSNRGYAYGGNLMEYGGPDYPWLTVKRYPLADYAFDALYNPSSPRNYARYASRKAAAPARATAGTSVPQSSSEAESYYSNLSPDLTPSLNEGIQYNLAGLSDEQYNQFLSAIGSRRNSQVNTARGTQRVVSNPQAWGKGLNYYNLQDPTGDAFSDMFVNPSNDRRQQSAYTQDYKNFNYGLEQLKRTNPERYRQYLSVMQSGVNKTGNSTMTEDQIRKGAFDLVASNLHDLNGAGFHWYNSNMANHGNFGVYTAGKKASPTEDKLNLKDIPWDDRGKVDWLRYAPVVGGALGVFNDLLGKTNKPDYSYGNYIANSVRNVGRMGAPHIGNYLPYNPIDKQYYLNMLNAQTMAANESLADNSGGNRAALNAGLLASQNNYGNQIGDLGMRAKQYNDNLRQSVAAFNRGTDQYNADQDYRVNAANMDLGKQYMAAANAAAQLNMQQDLMASQGKSANLTNLFNSLGDIGRESQQRGWLLNLARHGVFGSGMETNDAYKKRTAAYGGQLYTKKKKHITY